MSNDPVEQANAIRRKIPLPAPRNLQSLLLKDDKNEPRILVTELVEYIAELDELGLLNEKYENLQLRDCVNALAFTSAYLSFHNWTKVYRMQLIDQCPHFFCYTGFRKNVESKGSQLAVQEETLEGAVAILIATVERKEGCNGIQFLKTLVDILKKIDSQKPRAIIIITRGQLNISQAEFTMLEKYTLNQVIQDARQLQKLTEEIRGLKSFTISLILNESFDLTLNILLATDYRISYNRKAISFWTTSLWRRCFFSSEITIRYAQLSSIPVTLNLLKNGRGLTNVETFFSFQLIDRFFPSQPYHVESEGITPIIIYDALNCALMIDYENLLYERRITAERRFYSYKSNHLFWDNQRKILDAEVDDCDRELYHRIFEYIRRRASKFDSVDRYKEESIIEIFDTIDTRGIITTSNVLLGNDNRPGRTERMKIGIVGYHPIECSAAKQFLQYCDLLFFDINDNDKIQIEAQLPWIRNPNITKVKYASSFEELKTMNAVVISYQPWRRESIKEILAQVEDQIEPNVPVAIGIGIADLKSLYKWATIPNRIFSLHFFVPVSSPCAVFLTSHSSANYQLTFIEKFQDIAHDNRFTSLITYQQDKYGGFIMIRALLSFASELCQQIIDGFFNSTIEITSALLDVGILENLLLLMDTIGLDVLLNYAEVLSGKDNQLEVNWNLDLMKKFVQHNRRGIETFGGWICYSQNEDKFPSFILDLQNVRKKRFIEKQKQAMKHRLVLSIVNETLLWYENVTGEKEFEFVEVAFLQVFGFGNRNYGPFRYADEILPKHENLIRHGQYCNLLKERAKFNSPKFFANSPK